MLTLEPLVVEAYSRVSGTAADIIVLVLHVALPLLLASVALVRAARSPMPPVAAPPSRWLRAWALSRTASLSSRPM